MTHAHALPERAAAPFLVLGLRSRTFWLSRFLSYADWRCGHDDSVRLRSPADIVSWASQPKTGAADTLAAAWWRLFPTYAPGLRIVTVRRDPAEIEASIRRHGAFPDWKGRAAAVRQFCRKLDQIEKRVPGVLSVRFEDLAHEETCAAVFEHCLPYRHDHGWWASLAEQNLQADIVAQNRYAAAYMAQIAKMARTARHLALRAMERRHPAPDGFDISTGPFETEFPLLARRFEEHMAATGQDTGDYLKKNIPLLEFLSRRGRAFFTVARSNGRPFAYQLSLLGPDLESEDTVGHLFAVYASPDVPGIGRKTRQAAIAHLRSAGAQRIYARWGVRGSGGRLSAADKRMGFETLGEVGMLDFKGAA